jgi:hypothetical protein
MASAVRDNQSTPARPIARMPEPAVVGSQRPDRAITARSLSAARSFSAASAALILAGGYVHFCLYRHGYRFIPKIGVSFLLQATSSVVLAAFLLRGGRRRVGPRSMELAQLTRLFAIGLSVGTLAALGIAHTQGGLFQFHEIGLRPAPQTLVAIAAESLATLLLGVAVLEDRAAARKQTVTALVTPPARRPARHAA